MCFAEHKAHGENGGKRQSNGQQVILGRVQNSISQEKRYMPSSCREAASDSTRDQVLLCVVVDQFITHNMLR